MTSLPAIVEPLRHTDVEQAALLHMDYLTERLSGITGRRLLQLYYSLLSEEQGGFCLAYRALPARSCAGLVVMRLPGASVAQALLRRYPVEILFWLVRYLIEQPHYLYEIPRRLHDRQTPHSFVIGPGDCMLHALVVSAQLAGRGIGKALTEAALREARRRGFARVLTATYTTNGPANRVYQQAGFVLLESIAEGRHMVNWYSYKVQ